MLHDSNPMKSFGTTLAMIVLLSGVAVSGYVFSGTDVFAPESDPPASSGRVTAGEEIPSVDASIVGTIREEMPSFPNFFPLPKSEVAGPRGPVRVEGVPQIEMNARAVFAVTDRGEVLFEHNADQVLPIASISKLMTALVATEQLAYDAPVPISAEAIATEGNLGDLYSGETLSLHDALLAMLLPSSNDAAVAIAEALGGVEVTVNAMNAEAVDRGWKGSVFRNPHGLTPGGNDMSARHVSEMLFATLDTPILGEMLRQHSVKTTSLDGIAHTFTHRGNGLTEFPGVLGLKTGYTDESQGTLAFAFTPDPESDRRVAIVVLGSLDRSGDVESLARWISAAYTFPQEATSD